MRCAHPVPGRRLPQTLGVEGTRLLPPTTMTNTKETAAKWTAFIADRPEFPAGERLLEALRAGEIIRLCDCGCNAFDLTVPKDSGVKPISKTGGYGSVFEISFEARGEGPPNNQGSLEFIVFADNQGHLSGIEVDFCGNSYPIPNSLEVASAPYHVRCSAAIDA